MQNKILKKMQIFVFAIAFVLLLAPLNVEASNDNVCVVDDANLLTDEEISDLEDYLDSLNSDVNYLAVTSDTSDYGKNADARLESYYTSIFAGESDGVAFIIDMYDREIVLAGYGDIDGKISNADALDISDNTYTYASKQEYYNCFYKAFYQADAIINKGFILRPMRIIVAFLISLLLGYLGTFIFAILERSKEELPDSTAEIIMAGAAIAGSATIYDTKKILKQTSSSGSSHSGGGYHSSSYSGGGFHSSGGSHHSSGGSHHSSGGSHHSSGGHKF